MEKEKQDELKHVLKNYSNKSNKQQRRSKLKSFKKGSAKFVGGVAIVHVGGNSETEMKEKKIE